MTATAKTYKEARQIASDFRATFAGCDWNVRIQFPLFVGDLYYVIVE